MTAQHAPLSAATRQDLLSAFQPLVRTIAARLVRRLPPSVDLNEMIGVGMLGFIDAVDRYDPERGVPFKGYAEIRIQGAMLDALRQDDWVPRSVRRKSRLLTETRTRLEHGLGRAPTRDEMAEVLDVSPSAYDAMVCDARVSPVISLDAPTSEEGQAPLSERIEGDAETPEHLLGAAQLDGLIGRAVRCLPEKERVVVTRYYLNGLTLKQIGAQLGVSESRACQLCSQGISRLRYRLRHTVH